MRSKTVSKYCAPLQEQALLMEIELDPESDTSEQTVSESLLVFVTNCNEISRTPKEATLGAELSPEVIFRSRLDPLCKTFPTNV